MANRYWVGGTGTWDELDTSHWSASSGGASGASVPLNTDTAIFDANSDTAGAVFDVDVFIDFGGILSITGVVSGSTITIRAGITLVVTNLTSDGSMNFSVPSTSIFRLETSGDIVFTSGGSIFSGAGGFEFVCLNNVTLGSDLVATNTLGVQFTMSANKTFNAAGYNVTTHSVGFFGSAPASGAFINMGSGTWSFVENFSIGTDAETHLISDSANLLIPENSDVDVTILGTLDRTFNSITISGPTDFLTSVSDPQPDLFFGTTTINSTAEVVRFSFAHQWSLGVFSAHGTTSSNLTLASYDGITYFWSMEADSVDCSYINLSSSWAYFGDASPPGPPYEAGIGSVDGGNNKNWAFSFKNLYLQVVQMVGAETGDVQTLNAGKSDDSTPIYYELETQDIEFENRAHFKTISDKIVVFANDGMDSALEVKSDENNYKPVQILLDNDVNIGQNIDTSGFYFNFKWSGTTSESSPVLEGIQLEKITDQGIVYG